MDKIFELLPNWEISKNKSRIYIKSEHFYIKINTSDIRGSMYIHNMVDIHNSIDYVTEFLLLNNFTYERRWYDNNKYYRYFNKQKIITVTLDGNFMYNVSYGSFNEHNYYNSQQLLIVLREKLDLDSLNKPVIINE
jgi:hypothetical protein